MFNYSSDDAQKKAQQLKDMLSKNNRSNSGGENNKFKWFGFPSGEEKVTLRILPIFWDGGYMMVYRHNDLPGEAKSFLCLQTHGMNCPICEVVRQYEGKMDMKNWRAGVKVYVNGLYVRATDAKGNLITLTDRNKQPYVSKTPYLMPLSMTVFQWVVESLADPDKGDIVHPKNGRNIILQRERFNGPFKKEFAFQTSTIGDTEEETQNILNGMTKITDIWKTPDDDFMKRCKESAGLLDATLTQRMAELSGGLGGMNAIHPRQQAAPTPAQMMGNPAFTQSAPPVMPQPSAAPAVGPATGLAPAAQPAVAAPTVQNGTMASGSTTVPGAAPKVGAVPPGAPSCFANSGVFDRASNKCMICNYDYHCERAIANAKQA